MWNSHLAGSLSGSRAGLAVSPLNAPNLPLDTCPVFLYYGVQLTDELRAGLALSFRDC